MVESFLPLLPGLRPLGAAVSIDGREIGTIFFGEESGEERPARFPLPPESGTEGEAAVTLESDGTWIPNKVLEGNPDYRRLSIALRSIGFSGAARDSGSCVERGSGRGPEGLAGAGR